MLSLLAQSTGAATQQVPTSKARAENVTHQVKGDVVVISFDLVSTTPTAAFRLDLLVSDDGGRTFTRTAASVTGDVDAVKPGRGKKIEWRWRQDVPEPATLRTDQLRFEFQATEVPAPPTTGAAPPPSSGGSKKKIWIPVIAGAGAAVAILLLTGEDPPPPPVTCTFSLNPPSLNLSGIAQTGGPVAVDATPGGCAPNTWTALITNNPQNMLSGINPPSGSAGETFVFQVAANPGAARTGTITVTPASGSPLTLSVTQALTACTYNITRSTAGNLPSIQTDFLVSVTASQSTCTWRLTVNPNPQNFIRFLNGAADQLSFTGTGTVNNGVMVRALANGTGLPRTATMLITDLVTNTVQPQTLVLTQNQ
jgi:hypothetical protein